MILGNIFSTVTLTLLILKRSGWSLRCHSCELQEPFINCKAVHPPDVQQCEDKPESRCVYAILRDKPGTSITSYFNRNETARKYLFCGKNTFCDKDKSNQNKNNFTFVGVEVDPDACSVCDIDFCNIRNITACSIRKKYKKQDSKFGWSVAPYSVGFR
ncbi:hypothetical protein ILUMI_09680 [Ignelater luminosus]|uniref:Sodefrin-like factor n=1 Tax=Ignelater luminosus TaxID=2038154 RepID=A0A8K0CZB0_IGNLU|nr:hypothetical protein ILUMI_09680 [Ignelater luminosus]